jgi:hypothetical protein
VLADVEAQRVGEVLKTSLSAEDEKELSQDSGVS